MLPIDLNIGDSILHLISPYINVGAPAAPFLIKGLKSSVRIKVLTYKCYY